ncbi:MAG: hypothetical protein H7328_00135 [Bdellovibrio sp.]|nr:hypothetical protein [Bdellovibrio sp.]
MSSIKVKLILSSLFICTSVFAFDRADLHKTSFDKTENRYPSVLGILESLKRIAPFQKVAQLKSEIDACQLVGPDSAPIMGAIDPMQLQPLENLPGALFFNHFEKCVKQIVILGFSDATNAKKNSEVILGSDLNRALGNASWANIAFSQINAETQNLIVDRMIYFLIGPEEVVRYFNYIGPTNVFRAKIDSAAELRQFLRDNLLKANANDSLLGFYTRLATLLRLGPVLKN